MARNYFITGGAGFIGSNYVYRLLQRGENVTVYDNLSRVGASKNIAWLQQEFGKDAFKLIIGDLRDFPLLAESVKDADVIVHLAGQVAVTTSVMNPREDFEVNALGTFNALEAARLSERNPIFLYSSTNKVYGGMEDVEIVEEETRWRYRDLAEGTPETQPLDFHSPYGCCYSEDTEILTRCGWKKFYALNGADEVLTYNLEKNIAEYQKPVAFFAYPYQGKMYVQHHRRLQTCVTPNHKMLVAWKRDHRELKRPRLLEAQAIQGKPMAYLLAADFCGGETREYFSLPGIRDLRIQDWLRFLGWYLAEGEVETTGDGTIRLAHGGRDQDAVQVMRTIGLAPVVDEHHVVASSLPLHEYLKQLGTHQSRSIPPEIKALHADHLRVLLHSLLDHGGAKKGKSGWRYRTGSRQFADDVQEIAIKCGMAASVQPTPDGRYRIDLYTVRTAQCNVGADRSEWRDYQGTVYCVEVPNSTVMVRQNGHAYFSGNSKGTGDQYVRDYSRIYGLRSVVFRQSAIYGTRQFGVEDQGWMAWFVIAAVTGRPITIYGDGKQVRDMLWVDDLTEAYDLAVEKIDVAKGQVYNMGGGPRNTISVWQEFRPKLEALLGRKIEYTYGDWRPGDQRVFYADVRKAERELGWKPKTSLDEGIQRLFEWVKANKDLF
jgi:nucleoside-diphosphate-sugar epimerase